MTRFITTRIELVIATLSTTLLVGPLVIAGAMFVGASI
jgi:hypothetical protein